MWMWSQFPLFGSALILGVMLAAAYTMGIAILAHRTGNVRTLFAARLAGYGTSALIATTVSALAYAFVSHDFRLRYVTHNSDRSMSNWFLLTALWGGQDGSLLWWLFLLSLYIAALLWWLGGRYRELQPAILATLMGVVLFFCVLMVFSANPFSTTLSPPALDGQGLNPLLQDLYMIIHPPSLYIGFVGCTVPFAFAVAALVTGRLDTSEWLVASRKWTLFAWAFLALGNMLGMLWSYVELGWGGYWAWDPVENAAFMPFLTASAFVHSVMIQERRGMFRTWNVFLVCFTFFMTIFGTFLTRSGAIASVHSFAQSSIGTYFVYFLALLFVVLFSLILFRWPELRGYPREPRLRWAALAAGWVVVLGISPGLKIFLGYPALPLALRVAILSVLTAIAVSSAVELVYRRMTRGLALRSQIPSWESVLSREFTFLLNNWALLSFLLFVLVATTFPMITEAVWNEKVSVGPPYYDAIVQPIGLVIFFLMGFGTILGWRKTSEHVLWRELRYACSAMAVAMVLHLAFGHWAGFPAVVFREAIYPGTFGAVLRAFNALTPLLAGGLIAFNGTVIVREFVMLFRSRKKTRAGESLPGWLYGIGLGYLLTLFTLSPNARRRYGGYIVHMGICVMFFGFLGRSWNVEHEASLRPGETTEVARQLDASKFPPRPAEKRSLYTVKYTGARVEVDTEKRMVFADLEVWKGGDFFGKASPAKFIYKRSPQTPTTEVALIHSARDDLYAIVGSVDFDTKVATLRLHVNPLVPWIWLGFAVLFLGSIVCMWPEFSPEESRIFSFAKGGAAVAASITFGVVLAMLPAPARAQSASSSHAGTVHIENAEERQLFAGLRCMCGSCPRDLLSTCSCSVAEDTRAEIRNDLALGKSREEIVSAYVAKHGTAALAIPPNTGAHQAIWALPLLGLVLGGLGVGLFVRKRRAAVESPEAAAKTSRTAVDYDKRIDDDLETGNP